ncbi:MAG: hypothetical protein MUE77_12110 [Sandarakinorhabdus sp.]|jgi:hypothetical protein|nr:hypothetical protein [Sandarakinorhabdus sp.]
MSDPLGEFTYLDGGLLPDALVCDTPSVPGQDGLAIGISLTSFAPDQPICIRIQGEDGQAIAALLSEVQLVGLITAGFGLLDQLRRRRASGGQAGHA